MESAKVDESTAVLAHAGGLEVYLGSLNDWGEDHMKKLLLSGFFLCFPALAAHSAIITADDVTITGIGGSTGTFDKGGVSGGVATQCGQATGASYTVVDTCGVIKVNGLFGNAQFQQDPRIDGLGDGDLEDSLLFTFNSEVDFGSATLSGFELLSNYDLYINDVLIFNEETATPLDLTGNSGTSLRLVADTNFDFFYLNSLEVMPSIGSGPTTPPQEVSSPATALLLLPGLWGLFGISRLRHRGNSYIKL